MVKPQLDVVLKCYLSLMNECDNEELVSAFETMTKIFEEDIAPFAC